jgi:hypothetical protein
MNAKLTLLLAALLLCPALGRSADPPKGWIKAGSHPNEYSMTADRVTSHTGKASAQIKCIAIHPKGFGTLMQTFNARIYRGQRIRFSGFVKAIDAEGAGLWMRVDGSRRKNLAFDNMSPRPITGTVEWKKYEIVLDVPEQSESISFGLLTQKGQLWMDDLKFEEVGKDVPVTDLQTAEPAEPGKPTNLDFEETETRIEP